MFVQQFAKADIKGNIKAPLHRPFVTGIHRSPMDSPRIEPVMRSMFPFRDVIMISHKFVCFEPVIDVQVTGEYHFI